MIKENNIRYHGTYTSNNQQLHYHIYKNPYADNDNKLVLLHGIRVGGVETWDPVAKRLSNWAEILVPDLLGTGSLNPNNITDHDFDLKILAQSIVDLVNFHQWAAFDLIGYSYGGLISKILTRDLGARILNHLIIESAVLIDKQENLPALANGLLAIAELMKTQPDVGNAQFSKLVSDPKRQRYSLKLNTRPVPNILGFANLLKILADYYCNHDIESVLDAQHATSMLLTRPISQEKLNMLASLQKNRDWKILYIDDADHSVVFSKPDTVVETINMWGKQQ